MQALVIANPRATTTSGRHRAALHRLLSDVADVEIAETEHRGHATDLARDAMREGVDVVVALGGDGTVNEAVNGLLADGVHDGVPALGVVPAGSANVFARALGLPNDAGKATAALAESLRTGRRRRIGLGMADDRYFTFAAGLGYDAAIVAAVEKHRHRGRKSTPVLFGWEATKQFFLAEDRRAPRVHVEFPGGRVLDDVYWAVIANTDPWTYMGPLPMRLTPGASFDTGLDVFARLRMDVPSSLWQVTQLWLPNPRPGSKAAEVLHDLAEFTVRADEPLPFQLDGEVLGACDKVAFRSVPGALVVTV